MLRPRDLDVEHMVPALLEVALEVLDRGALDAGDEVVARSVVGRELAGLDAAAVLPGALEATAARIEQTSL